MALDKATIAHIAHLARIRVEDDELERLAGELNNIIGWAEQLAEVDTEGVAPMSSVVEVALPRREDAVTDGDCRDDLLKNAPAAERGFFTVPKVVE